MDTEHSLTIKSGISCVSDDLSEIMSSILGP